MLIISLQAFQKGSPLAADVSEAFVTITENGILKELEDKWFPRSAKCSSTETDEVSLGKLKALYLLSFATSTICYLLFFLRLLMASTSIESIWIRTVQLVPFFLINGQSPTDTPFEGPLNLSPPLTGDEWVSLRWSTVTPSEAREETPQASPPTTACFYSH